MAPVGAMETSWALISPWSSKTRWAGVAHGIESAGDLAESKEAHQMTGLLFLILKIKDC